MRPDYPYLPAPQSVLFSRQGPGPGPPEVQVVAFVYAVVGGSSRHVQYGATVLFVL